MNNLLAANRTGVSPVGIQKAEKAALIELRVIDE
jgi:hypothetical protein